EVAVQPFEETMRCAEMRNGKTLGELEISTFHGALVIDRDGILANKVNEMLAAAREPGARVSPPMYVAYPFASGYRGDLIRPMRPALPYLYLFALGAYDLALDGALLVTVRCAQPEWPAGDAILQSLRPWTKRGPTANDDTGSIQLPMIGGR